MPPLEQKARLIARAPNAGDMLHYLELFRDSVYDIRTDLGIEASNEVRQSTASILQKAIDKLRALRDNPRQRSPGPMSHLDD